MRCKVEAVPLHSSQRAPKGDAARLDYVTKVSTYQRYMIVSGADCLYTRACTVLHATSSAFKRWKTQNRRGTVQVAHDT